LWFLSHDSGEHGCAPVVLTGFVYYCLAQLARLVALSALPAGVGTLPGPALAPVAAALGVAGARLALARTPRTLAPGPRVLACGAGWALAAVLASPAPELWLGARGREHDPAMLVLGAAGGLRALRGGALVAAAGARRGWLAGQGFRDLFSLVFVFFFFFFFFDTDTIGNTV
jgi:hypothetical protein